MKQKEPLERLLTESAGKKLLLLGREGLFERKEIERFLKPYQISITDTPDEQTVATIEPLSLNPVEEMMSEQAYEMGIPSYDLVVLEELISQTIDDDALLMAIKLGNDQGRILRLLANPHISDALFVRLLKMYRWSDEEEESRDDRDVIMHTLRRYIEIKPSEEDLLYSYLTLRRLATEATDPALMDALLNFPNFEFLVRGRGRVTLRETIAANEHIDSDLIRRLLTFRNKKVERALAGNPSVDADTLEILMQRGDPEIYKALAINPAISEAVFDALLEEGSGIALLLMRQPITMVRYEKIRQQIKAPEQLALIGANEQLDGEVVALLLEMDDNPVLLENLAANPTLNRGVLEYIYQKSIPSTYAALAQNPNTDPALLEQFYQEANEDQAMLQSLAQNRSTPETILRALFERHDLEIHRALATNSALPADILDVLKIDTRLQNELAQNEQLIRSYEAVLNQGKVMVNL
jgi:hypothetical protein